MPEPASASPVELPQKAVAGFVCKVDRRKRYVRRGEVVQPGDPLLAKHPERFVPVTVTPDEEREARVLLATKRTCVHCRGRYHKKNAPEDAPMCCSESCVKARKKRFADFMKSAAKKRVPKDIAAIERDIETGRCIENAWRGREEVTVELPSPRARSLVRRHRDLLQKSLKTANDERRRENERRHEQARKDALRQAMKQDQEATDAAREELVKSAGNISKG